ncbi:malto-oligosyltrehalose synthase [Falsirhodobacter xinxiangensis]|uniref:malto-oligosyltrehalose synthase n=1 Tax=Falsirhodobacter xinxiangensis TaxID=2530049 RepID=UPI0010AABB53|nr:malto-oligosyltrehalose synthase [Rhodobacter xinxiangensis]
MTLPTAIYHLLLREGRSFDTASDLLPHLAETGYSHLYLSPILQATPGSTHGYDVSDPTRIDESLGGIDGFARLADAARVQGIGIILDVVPNHTACNLSNPWLLDVLRHGEASRYARHFDIDWARGRLVLPFLPAPFATVIETFRLEDKNGGILTDGLLELPLAPGTLPSDGHDDPDIIAAVHEAQHWRLAHWELERDGITHRRFFNVTGLIGMRVEDRQVFEDMHAATFDLVRRGWVQGLRIDHIDGLADPETYLDWLAEDLPGTPVWVEKILTGDEALPDWRTLGTTGYESARALARVLTNPSGLEEIDRQWREATGATGDFEAALEEAKGEVIRQDLAAELLQLVALARAAAEQDPEAEPGDESLREAILRLLIHFPRYRTYFTDRTRRGEDLALMDALVEQASQGLRTDATVRLVAGFVTDAASDPARAFRTRFQQVTGALLAKSHEDTAAFRWNRYLAANEVGSLPDEASMTVQAFDDWMQKVQPAHMNLTSTHDTKRAEDARMRLVAISHMPDSFLALWRRASDMPQADAVDANLRWYILQSLLAMWEPDRGDIEDRLRAHIEKAMREAKRITSWTHPDAAAEAAPLAFAHALCRSWTLGLPEDAHPLLDRADRLTLVQTALKLTMPGIPYVYQGTEVSAHNLTDPDNRLPVDHAAVRGATCAKSRLTRVLVDLRRKMPDFFRDAGVRVDQPAPGQLRLIRQGASGRLTVTAALDASTPAPGNLWPDRENGPVSVLWEPR